MCFGKKPWLKLWLKQGHDLLLHREWIINLQIRFMACSANSHQGDSDVLASPSSHGILPYIKTQIKLRSVWGCFVIIFFMHLSVLLLWRLNDVGAVFPNESPDKERNRASRWTAKPVKNGPVCMPLYDPRECERDKETGREKIVR